ncbi:SPOR domain-containing protein [Legionella sp. km772]|uniref:SPOR domain-containing protein n=1 Tax=Legionella sp. km772 TaxID=2498111 RepID=UPI000F8ECEF4|nr:SPOR domain-containing protein [Legionella sp. km772]RUR09591.1 SPOR domain-containing protein [Legionella sp. km772]
MKLVIDEKLKHRLIGVAVIISLGAIFAPAMMKKSNQNIENNYSVRVKLPSKPAEPNVAIADEKEVFKTIKIAKVEIPPVSAESQLPELAKAEVIHSDVETAHESASLEQPRDDSSLESVQLALNRAAQNTVKHASQVASTANTKVVSKPTVVAANKTVKQVKKPTVVAVKARAKPQPVKVANRTIAKKPMTRSDVYAVQLASFSRLSNAQALVSRLRTKGYKANFIKVASKQGVSYKVFAGHSPRKDDVIRLKSQLASAMQLNGFVVNTGVS